MYTNKVGVYRDAFSLPDSRKFNGLAGSNMNKVSTNFTTSLEKDLRNIKRESISKDHLIQRLEFQLELAGKHHDQEKALLQKRLGTLMDQHMSQEKTIMALRQDNDYLHKQITFVQATNSALQRRVTEVMRQLALERTRYQTEITGLKRKVATFGMQSRENFTTKLASPRVIVNHQAKIYRDCLKEQQKHYDEEIIKTKDRPGVYGLSSMKTPVTPSAWRKGTPAHVE